MPTRPLVVLVDDSPDDVVITTQAIQASGVPCRLEVLRSAEEAVDYIRRWKGQAHRLFYDLPVLFFLDVNLGVMSGFDILHLIRADPELRMTPVVMLSSSDEPRDIRQAYGLGANGYVRKSLGIEEVRARTVITLKYWLEINLSAREVPKPTS